MAKKPHYRLVQTPSGARMVPVAVVPPPPSWRAYARLMRLDKPVGILLLLWPTLWALLLAADGMPPIGTLLIFLSGVVLTRSAGCVINDYADRWLDPNVERTRSRPLATGEVTARGALTLFVILMLAALCLVLLTNPATIALAVIAALLAVLYPFAKRFIAFPQVVLGAAFSMAIPMAYTAIRGEVDPVAVLLFCANLLWTTAYDTLYAMVDREDDIEAGARSTAILFGDLDLVATGILHASALGTLAIVGHRAELNTAFYFGLGVAAMLMAWQLWYARDRERDACFTAFKANNWVGLAITLGLAAAVLSYRY